MAITKVADIPARDALSPAEGDIAIVAGVDAYKYISGSWTLMEKSLTNNVELNTGNNSKITFDLSNYITSDDSSLTYSITQPDDGVATLSDSSVTFTPNVNYEGINHFTYTVTDSDSQADTANVIINTRALVGPTANDDNVSTSYNTPLLINIISNDINGDSSELYISHFDQPSNGVITELNGVILYEPNQDYYGDDSFDYMITDGFGKTSSATVTVTIPQPVPPIAIDDSYSGLYRNVEFTMSVLTNDIDNFGQGITIQSFTQPSFGTVTQSNNELTYNPNGFSGTTSFTYTIVDGNGLTDTATISISVLELDFTSPLNLVYFAANANISYDDILPASVNSQRGGSDVLVTFPPNNDFKFSMTATTMTITGNNGVTGNHTIPYTVSIDGGPIVNYNLEVIVSGIDPVTLSGSGSSNSEGVVSGSATTQTTSSGHLARIRNGDLGVRQAMTSLDRFDVSERTTFDTGPNDEDEEFYHTESTSGIITLEMNGTATIPNVTPFGYGKLLTTFNANITGDKKYERTYTSLIAPNDSLVVTRDYGQLTANTTVLGGDDGNKGVITTPETEETAGLLKTVFNQPILGEIVETGELNMSFTLSANGNDQSVIAFGRVTNNYLNLPDVAVSRTL